MNLPDNAWTVAAFRADLALMVLSEQTVPGLLDVIVNLAVTTVPRVDAASVSLVVHDGERLETTSATTLAVRAADEAQYRCGGRAVRRSHQDRRRGGRAAPGAAMARVFFRRRRTGLLLGVVVPAPPAGQDARRPQPVLQSRAP